MVNTVAKGTDKKYLNGIFIPLLLYTVLFTVQAHLFFQRAGIKSGTMYIVTAAVSFVPVAFYFVKNKKKEELSAVEKNMQVRKFVVLFLIITAVNLLVTQVQVPLEKILGIAGMSAAGTAETSAHVKDLGYFLYVCIAGPVFEELIYRGFLMNGLRKYGKMSAIVISAICFGLMHHDLYQGIVAFAVGLVYGYAAWNYSLAAAAGLHIANNSFVELLPLLKESGTAGAFVLLLIVSAAAVTLLVCTVKYVISFINRKNRIAVKIRKTGDSWFEIMRNLLFWMVIIFDGLMLVFQSFHRV